jgi:hypothetical protein
MVWFHQKGMHHLASLGDASYFEVIKVSQSLSLSHPSMKLLKKFHQKGIGCFASLNILS